MPTDARFVRRLRCRLVGHELTCVAQPMSEFVERRWCRACGGSFARFTERAGLIGQPPGALVAWDDDIDDFYRRRATPTGGRQ